MTVPFVSVWLWNKCRVFAFTVGNEWRKIRLRMTLKINVGCLSLASEMNDGNIQLRMTLKTNVGCLSLASEMNDGNIQLRMTGAKNKCRMFVFSVRNEWR